MDEVCIEEKAVFVCQQTGSPSTWIVNLNDGRRLENSAAATQAGMVLPLSNEPGFGFEIRVLNASQNGLFTELRVTVVREFDGVTVICQFGSSANYMSTIRVVTFGESSLNRHLLEVKINE